MGAIAVSEETLNVETEQESEMERHTLSERDVPTISAPGIGVEARNSVETNSLASSGNKSIHESQVFPELIQATFQALAPPPGSLLPQSLKRAIAQHPDRVQPAIAYFHHQQLGILGL